MVRGRETEEGLPYMFRRRVFLCFYPSFRMSRSLVWHLNGGLSRKALLNHALPRFNPRYRELYNFFTETC